MRVRYSRLPATYFRVPEQKKNYKIGISGMNQRLSVADRAPRDHFPSARGGRSMWCVRLGTRGSRASNATTTTSSGTWRWTSTRRWTASSTSRPEEAAGGSRPSGSGPCSTTRPIWRRPSLRCGGVYGKESLVIRAEAEETKKRASEAIKKEAAKFKTNKAAPLSDARKKEADENADREVNRRASRSGKKVADERRDFEAEVKENPDVVLEEDLTGAPFYRGEGAVPRRSCGSTGRTSSTARSTRAPKRARGCARRWSCSSGLLWRASSSIVDGCGQ